MTKLLPCPFCGGKPEMIDARTGSQDVWLVRCTEVDCQCKTVNTYGDRCALIWNNRLLGPGQAARN